jgi:adenylosuccinate lyase
MWRKLWEALADAQNKSGLLTQEEYIDILDHQDHLDLNQSFETEKITKHDLVSELKVFASQCLIGGSKIHLGATSCDIKDNADVLCIQASLSIISNKLLLLLENLSELITHHKKDLILGYTHLQPAELTTVGYRFAQYHQDLESDLDRLNSFCLRMKGFKGAVGTASSYVNLLGVEKTKSIDQEISLIFGLPVYKVTTQIYPRKQDFEVISIMASICQSMSKMALDLRVMQSQGVIKEFFDEGQVGSSAMPYKQNPITAEKINSLSRMILGHLITAWENASNNMLERTMDDSANRRIILPESFLIVDELLMSMTKLISNLRFEKTCSEDDITLSTIESAMSFAISKGADRQKVHELFKNRIHDQGLVGLDAWIDSHLGEYLSSTDFENLKKTNIFNTLEYIGSSLEKFSEKS